MEKTKRLFGDGRIKSFLTKANIPTLIFIVLLALSLRTLYIGQESFWVDEIGHIQAATQDNLQDLLANVKVHYGATPLDYLLLRLYIDLTGADDETTIRLLYAAYGTLSVIILFSLSNTVSNKVVATLSALALSISTFHISYSQEVRFYSLAVLLSLISTFLIIRLAKRFQWQIWILWILISIGGLYNMYFHGFVIASQLLYFLSSSNHSDTTRKNPYSDIVRKKIIPVSVAIITITIAFIPWVIWDNQSFDYYKDNPIPVTLSLAVNVIAESLGGRVWFISAIMLSAAYALRSKVGKLFLGQFLFSLFGATFLDISFGYFFSSRQVINVYPYLLISTFGGLYGLSMWLYKKTEPYILHKKIVCTTILVDLALAMLLPGIPTLVAYYNSYQKPNWRGAITYLNDQEVSSRDFILVFTSTEYKSISYHLDRSSLANPTIVYISDISEISGFKDIPSRFWIVRSILWNYWHVPREILIWADEQMESAVKFDNVYIISGDSIIYWPMKGR